MNKPRIPQTDSIKELAEFWDTHDPFDFEEELEEVTEPVFERLGESKLTVPLTKDEFSAIQQMAKTRGVRDVELVHQWVSEKIGAA